MKNCLIHFRFIFLILLLAVSRGDVFAQVIRCADPECPLCLSVPGAIPPEKPVTREPYRYPEDAPF